ncbi:pyrophosphorohydrolase [Bacillus phage NotTheCreek]|uniref:pyrophosphorohydrolase n=1 Tax=Bacillus phage NotTheCreek TaxID=1805952 RepID=UPI0007A77599|nr:pyrophosphorohydrolase [Bacillus phage NotTheCreek]AMW63412.1 pyrophosphorohydrolase [Bacillus phage NotTheCreek]
MIKANTAKEITLKSRLGEKNINLTDVDDHLDFLIQERAKKGKTDLIVTDDQMKNCEDLYYASHDNVIRTELRRRYEAMGYDVRFNRDETMKLKDLTLNWG